MPWRRGSPGSPSRVNEALAEVTLDGGRVVMVKRGDGDRAARSEATGLRWLADAGAVRIPTVHGHDDRWLVTDRVPTGRPNPGAAERFGRDLAALHAAGAPAFGSPPPGGPEDAYIGLAPMRNATGADWPGWYAEHRVLPYLRRAVDDGTIRSAESVVVERVCERLPELAGPPEPPARLHGDLWNGNVLWGADGHAWLIDPAAHGGHRETDLDVYKRQVPTWTSSWRATGSRLRWPTAGGAASRCTSSSRSWCTPSSSAAATRNRPSRRPRRPWADPSGER